MPLFKLIHSHFKPPLRVFLVLSALAGVSNILVVAILNDSAGMLQNPADLRTVAMFLLNIGTYVVSQRGLMRITATEVEAMIHNLRMGLLENIGKAELLPMESIDRSQLLAGMVRDMETLSQSGNLLMIAMQSVIMIVLGMAYIWITNTAAFVLSAGFVGLSVMLMARHLRETGERLKVVYAQEHRMYDGLRGMLDGFKEIRMNASRRTALLADIDLAAVRAREVKTTVQIHLAYGFVLTQALIYLGLGMIVFVVPAYSAIEPMTVARVIAALLFIAGPLALVAQSVGVFANANAAARNLDQLDRLLGALAAQAPAPVERPLPEPFEEIHFDSVSFSHADHRAAGSFTVGPLNFRIRRGDIVFITGANGSGKSTLLKLMAGLYHPTRGVIRVDRQALSAETYSAYRNQFSAIFSDYHLFKRLYGLEAPDPSVLEDLCELLELAGKLHADGTAPALVDLGLVDPGSGRSKRLAMLVALLEDKPILVLDQWAADQDPHFHRKFYLELLPRLKALGKTVIAVTHDNRYFDVADRRIALDEGCVVSDIHR